jgi:hypothetical protein
MSLDLNRAVCVKWLDAQVSVDGTPPTLPVMTSYGVVIVSAKDRICLCSMFGEDNEPRVVMAIPRSLIKTITKL